MHSSSMKKHPTRLVTTMPYMFLVALIITPSTTWAQSIKGEEIQIDEYKYLLRIFASEEANTPACTGIYVSEYWALSTTKCSLFKSGYVCGGESGPKSAATCKNKVKITSHLVHPFRDIGLMKLKAPFKQDSIIAFDVLKPLSEVREIKGKTCDCIGFTADSDEVKLMKVPMKVVSCEKPSNLCGQELDREQCMGEPGSPLLCGGSLYGVFIRPQEKACNDSARVGGAISHFESIKETNNFLLAVLGGVLFKNASQGFIITSSNCIMSRQNIAICVGNYVRMSTNTACPKHTASIFEIVELGDDFSLMQVIYDNIPSYDKATFVSLKKDIRKFVGKWRCKIYGWSMNGQSLVSATVKIIAYGASYRAVAEGKTSICANDIGAPIVCDRYLVGIVSGLDQPACKEGATFKLSVYTGQARRIYTLMNANPF